MAVHSVEITGFNTFSFFSLSSAEAEIQISLGGCIGRLAQSLPIIQIATSTIERTCNEDLREPPEPPATFLNTDAWA
jgi:hypothetical protein